jgi:hypothetical protein
MPCGRSVGGGETQTDAGLNGRLSQWPCGRIAGNGSPVREPAWQPAFADYLGLGYVGYFLNLTVVINYVDGPRFDDGALHLLVQTYAKGHLTSSRERVIRAIEYGVFVLVKFRVALNGDNFARPKTFRGGGLG